MKIAIAGKGGVGKTLVASGIAWSFARRGFRTIAVDADPTPNLGISLGLTLSEAASIGVIGAIDGPTAIFVATKLAPQLLGPIDVAAYSYMSLVPIIQPPIMRLLTTKRERLIKMEYAPKPVSDKAVIIFPIAVTIIISLIAPDAAPLIATLMLGNLLKESGVVDRLSKSAANEIINVSNPNGPLKVYSVDGNVCETGDTFTQDQPREIPEIREGDVLGILDAGEFFVVDRFTKHFVAQGVGFPGFGHPADSRQL